MAIEELETVKGVRERSHWTPPDPDSASKITRIVNSGMMSIAQPVARVNLNDVEAVRAAARRYWQSCAESGRLPTFAGLAVACGCSRKHLYERIRQAKDEVSTFLTIFQTACADCLMQAGLSNSANPVMSIFLLKNSGQGLADRSELEISASGRNDPFSSDDPDELRKYIQALPDPTANEDGEVDA